LADESESEDEKPETNKGFDYILSLFVATIASLIASGVQSNQDADGNKDDPDTQIARWTSVVGRWTRYLVGVGVITTAVLAVQGWAMIKQWNEMRTEQRPWVGISGLGPAKQTPRPTPGNDFYIFVNVSNGGKSPAVHVKPTYSAEFLEEPKRPQTPLAPCCYCGDGDVMLPGVPIGRTPHVEGSELTVEELADLSNKKAAIWLTGRIDYKDTAGNSYWTFICYRFEADGSFISCDVPHSNEAK
jgi:hypothetical protein